MTKEKILKLKLKLSEVITGDEGILLLTLFSNSQMISGIDGIKPILDTLNKQLHKFIDTTLIPNSKKKKG